MLYVVRLLGAYRRGVCLARLMCQLLGCTQRAESGVELAGGRASETEAEEERREHEEERERAALEEQAAKQEQQEELERALEEEMKQRATELRAVLVRICIRVARVRHATSALTSVAGTDRDATGA